MKIPMVVATTNHNFTPEELEELAKNYKSNSKLPVEIGFDSEQVVGHAERVRVSGQSLMVDLVFEDAMFEELQLFYACTHVDIGEEGTATKLLTIGLCATVQDSMLVTIGKMTRLYASAKWKHLRSTKPSKNRYKFVSVGSNDDRRARKAFMAEHNISPRQFKKLQREYRRKAKEVEND